jgi:hypothetical protein
MDNGNAPVRIAGISLGLVVLVRRVLILAITASSGRFGKYRRMRRI